MGYSRSSAVSSDQLNQSYRPADRGCVVIARAFGGDLAGARRISLDVVNVRAPIERCRLSMAHTRSGPSARLCARPGAGAQRKA